MKTIKQLSALAIVFLLIVAGVLLLIVDFDTVKETWLSIGGAIICITIGLVLGHVFNNKNLLPE